MQNIPSEFDDVPKDKKIKSIFVAPEGFKLLCADYSQIELRNLANVTEDEGIISAFNSGVDLHRQTASNIFGKPLDQVSSGERKMGKTANFGIVYGAGKFRLANEIDEKAGLSDRDVELALKNLGLPAGKDRLDSLINIAEKIRTMIFSAWPQVAQWQKQTINDCKQTGYVYTPFGRIRYLPLPKRPTDGQKIHMSNQAINTPIQSVSSDCLLLAMVALNEWLKEKKCKTHIIGQVHDSIIMYVENSELDSVLRITKKIMEEEPSKFLPAFFRVPLVVDIEVGDNWADMQEIILE